MNNAIAWPELLKARLGIFMDPAEADIWRDAIQDALSNVVEAEILAAVRIICERMRLGELPRNADVNANMIITGIIRARRMAKLGIPASAIATKEQRLETLKQKILVAPDHSARWEIICFPKESDFWPNLERFTIEHFPDFERPKFIPLTVAVEQLRRSMSGSDHSD